MNLLKKLTSVNAPSGHEKNLHEIIINELKDFADETNTDALGNLIIHKAGNGKKLMLAAHADEIGIIVTYIEENGLLRFGNVGGVRAAYALAQRVVFTNGTHGVVYYDKSKDIEKLSINDMYIDIGAKDRNEAQKLVGIGDMACFEGEFIEQGECIISKALDDRCGIYVLIEALKRAKCSPNDVYAVFTAQEELGLRGAKASAYNINPDIAIAIDVTDTGDLPGATAMAVSMGGGAAIKIKDSSIISSKYVVDLLKKTATENNIAYQLEVLTHGGTDAGAIHTMRGGTKTATLSLPTRYIHSPGEMINKSDIESCISILQKVIEQTL